MDGKISILCYIITIFQYVSGSKKLSSKTVWIGRCCSYEGRIYQNSDNTRHLVSFSAKLMRAFGQNAVGAIFDMAPKCAP